jgi:excisionase family DNA binding protein
VTGEWLSTGDVCDLLGVSTGCVKAMVADQALPCYRFGRVFRYKRTEVEAWVEQQRVHP